MDQPDRANPPGDAFERLVEEYADRVYNVALKITGVPADAEDAVQEAFLNAYQGWQRFRGESSPTTWLYRIAVNAALTRVRRRHPVDYLAELPAKLEVVDWSESVADAAIRSEVRDVILRSLLLLEPDQRAAVVLRDIDGLSGSEAAEVLEITEQAFKSRLHRGRALLRSYLADYFRES